MTSQQPDNPKARPGKHRPAVAALLTTAATAWAATAAIVAAQGAGATHLDPITFATLCCWTIAAALLGTILGLVVEGDSRLMDMWVLGVQLGDPDLDEILNRKRDWRAHPAVHWVASHTAAGAWSLAVYYTWSILSGAFPRPSTVQVMTLGALVAAGVGACVVSVVGRSHARVARAVDMACRTHRDLNAAHGDPAAAAARYEHDQTAAATGTARLRIVDTDTDSHAERPGRASGQ